MEQNQQPQPPVFNPQQQQQAPSQMPQYQPRVSARPTMNFIEAVKTCLRKYFTFTGRARRSEYWWYILFVFLVSVLGSMILPVLLAWLTDSLDMNAFMVYTILLTILVIALVIPTYSAMTRRLHDTGRSGWWVLAQFLCSLVYIACYAIVMIPCLDKLSSVDNPIVLSSILTNAMQEHQMAATIMSVCGIGSFILGIVNFIFTLLDSQWGENKYGPSPKYQ